MYVQYLSQATLLIQRYSITLKVLITAVALGFKVITLANFITLCFVFNTLQY